ncbi:unnamed protein product [Somion occarium]|uniref:EF-hand domain-containing protein n=1 Tax=Somion occarium TaxID=3059160 RepID=A0ABP1DYK1_9APHY
MVLPRLAKAVMAHLQGADTVPLKVKEDTVHRLEGMAHQEADTAVRLAAVMVRPEEVMAEPLAAVMEDRLEVVMVVLRLMVVLEALLEVLPLLLLQEPTLNFGRGSHRLIWTDQGTSPRMSFALINGDWSPFDLDTVKLLMTIFDTDRSGTIGFNEFAGLWKYIKDWQGVFKHFDRDQSGSIDGKELHEALKQFGYNLSPQLLTLVERKYDVEKATAPPVPGAHAPPPGISFDRFVRACVVIKTLTESFQRLDTDRDGWVQINYDQFMHTVLSAP